MAGKGNYKQYQIGLTPLQKEILGAIAMTLGLTYRDNLGRGKEVGSLSKLVRAIAEGGLLLFNPKESEIIKVVKLNEGNFLTYDLEMIPVDHIESD